MADQEAIAKRAYELYLERGSVPGYELEDWLAAEAELTAAEAKTSSPAVSANADASAEGERRAAPASGKRGSRRETASATRRALRP